MDENYANGFAKQLLYEAHVGRGNYYYSIGLYLDARKEYEAAEVLIWDQNNLMNLFFVEVDLGNTLGKLKDFKDAASYFKYTFEAVNYANRASSHSTFVSNIKNAIQLYTAGKYKDSYDLFESNLADNNVLFTEKGINVQMGNCLAFIAAQNQSTVQAILERNDLSGETIISADQTLIIPSMPK
jgi:tetratricopeptide (TPR) repeat protein